LRPDDIKVVAALGDSITAGFGAKGIQDGTIINLNNLAEDRGISFAAGGDDGAITIPNFLKHYNPNLIGASLGILWNFVGGFFVRHFSTTPLKIS